jgi:hypothetical protein
MSVYIWGHPAALSILEGHTTAPSPATGRHAELLAEITKSANLLIALVEVDRVGVCDGQGFWINTDRILDTARKLSVARKGF